MQKDSPSAETLTRTVAADFSTLPLAKQDNEHDCAQKSAQMSARIDKRNSRCQSQSTLRFALLRPLLEEFR